jgi:hypothetical protein
VPRCPIVPVSPVPVHTFHEHAGVPRCPIVHVSPVPVHPPYRLRGVLTSSQDDPCDPPTVTVDGVEQLGAVTGDFGARFTLLPPYLHSDA